MSKKGNKTKKTEKWGERGEAIRAYFVRLFGKYDFRNEQQFLYFGKWLIFSLLLLVEGLAVLDRGIDSAQKGEWLRFILFLAVVLVLSLSTALQFFAVKGIKGRMAFYVVDVVAACGFLFFVGGIYSLIIYMLLLTQFYFETKRTRYSVLLLVVSILLYMLAYGVQLSLLHGAAAWDFWRLAGVSFGFVLTILVHFIAVQIGLAFYRQFLKLDKTLQELDESKKELEKAYAVVAEVSALEERQRIAKEIHDTAGHSLTTVIMQTEAAKRIVDTDPTEAKSKLIAANLQARHALEELRDSVHLLSGTGVKGSLLDELTAIVHESTDGTGIKIRYEIADLSLLPAKHRFLCNSLKEGISNGLRHGKATAFWFELKEEEGEVKFLLSDNGKGAGEDLQLGFGLTTMGERAKALGGKMEFYSDGEEGFEICLSLPADERSE